MTVAAMDATAHTVPKGFDVQVCLSSCPLVFLSIEIICFLGLPNSVLRARGQNEETAVVRRWSRRGVYRGLPQGASYHRHPVIVLE